jgi:exonuclease III
VTSSLRIVNWNLNVFTANRRHDKLALLQLTDFDVLTVQECDPDTYDAFVDSDLAIRDHAYGLRMDGVVADRPERAHGVAVFVRGRARLLDSDVLRVLPEQQERGVVARVQDGRRSVEVLGWHAPNAVGKGPTRMVKKMAAYRAVTDWLVTHVGHCVVGMDANTPWRDPYERRGEPLDPGHPFFEDQRFYGMHQGHPMRDAWVLFLSDHDDLRERIVRLRPQGPLAVSYQRGVQGRITACRYDHILVSPEIHVSAMGYEYADAVGAGSDHALVWAELSV